MSSEDSNFGCTQNSLNKLITQSQSITLNPSHKTVEPRKTLLLLWPIKKDCVSILRVIAIIATTWKCCTQKKNLQCGRIHPYHRRGYLSDIKFQSHFARHALIQLKCNMEKDGNHSQIMPSFKKVTAWQQPVVERTNTVYLELIPSKPSTLGTALYAFGDYTHVLRPDLITGMLWFVEVKKLHIFCTKLTMNMDKKLSGSLSF